MERSQLIRTFQSREKLDLESELKDALDKIISFSSIYKEYCVCVVDAVNPTKITAALTKEQLCKYYSLFLGSMAIIATKFGASVVKNFIFLCFL